MAKFQWGAGKGKKNRWMPYAPAVQGHPAPSDGCEPDVFESDLASSGNDDDQVI